MSLPIKELNKPEGVPCKSLHYGQGCARYATRPNVCRDFACLWAMRVLEGGEELRPDNLGIVLKFEHQAGFGNYIEAFVRDLTTFTNHEDFLIAIGEKFGYPVGVRFLGTADGFFLNLSEEGFERLETAGLGKRRLPII